MPSTVKEIMVRRVRTTDADDTVLKATEIMNRYEIGCVIVAENGKAVGIATERDILKRIVAKKRDAEKIKISEIMSKPLKTVKPKTTIKRAIRIMVKEKIKKLAITWKGKLEGILSLTDAVAYLEKNNFKRISLQGAPKRVKRVFQVYYDPIRQIRKRCPLTLMGGSSISCLGSKCMWYVQEACVMISSLEKR